MAARKATSSDALVGILDRLERMVDYARQSADETALVLSSIAATTRDGVVVELVKQTRLLEGMSATLRTLGVRESTEQTAVLLDISRSVRAWDPEVSIMALDQLVELEKRVADVGRSLMEAGRLAVNRLITATDPASIVLAVREAASVLAERISAMQAAPGEAGRAVLGGIDAAYDRLSTVLGTLSAEMGQVILGGLDSATSRLVAVLDGLPSALARATVGGMDSIVAKLSAIEVLLSSRKGEGGAVDSRSAGAVGEMSRSLTMLIREAAKAGEVGEPLRKFIVSLADGVNDFLAKAPPERVKVMLTSIAALTRGAVLYALALTLAAPLLAVSLVGTRLYALSLTTLAKSAGGVDPKSLEGATVALALGRGALLFGLSLAGFALLAVPAMLGAAAFGLTTRIMMASISGVVADERRTDGVRSLLSLARGITLFALAMTVTALLFPAVLVGAVTFGLSVVVIALALRIAGTRESQEGVGSLFKISLGILFLGASMLLFSALVPPAAALYTALSVGVIALTFWVVGKGSQDIAQGAISMFFVSVSLSLLALSVLFFTSVATPADGLAVAMTVGVLGLVFMLAGAGPVPTMIASGSIAMGFASIALILTSIGLLIFKQAKFTAEDGVLLAATVVGLGAAMALAGIPPVALMIAVGSIAMITAAAALTLIAVGLAAMKATSFSREDSDRMSYALGSVVTAFLGGEMPGGIRESLRFAGQLAARSALLMVTVPPILFAAGALTMVAVGLRAFKALKFSEADGRSMEMAVASVVKALSIITDEDRQRELGIDVSPASLIASTISLVGAGNVVASLARGVQSVANLEIVENEVRNGKIVPKSVRKMKRGDFSAASRNIAEIIKTLAGPLADVGKIEKESSSGNPLFDAIFANGYISTGVDVLSGLGTTVATLATGIRDFANLQITEYTVKNGKLVPKSVVPMTRTDFVTASKNIGVVIGFLAKEFAAIGRMEDESDGLFSDGHVTNGIEAVEGLGNNLVSIAKGVVSMANMEFVENEVKVVDGRPTLVPKKVHRIGKPEMDAAAANMGMILGFLAHEFAKVGRMEAESDGWFSDGYVQKGRDAIAGIGKDVSSLVDAVLKMAASEYTTYAVRDGELVPVATRKMTPADLALASANMSRLIGSFALTMRSMGILFAANEDEIELATEFLPKFSSIITASADSLTAWTQVPDPAKATASLVAFVTSTKAMFDPERDKLLPLKLGYFSVFSRNMERLSASGPGLDRVALAADRIDKSMRGMKSSINDMDLKKLTLTDSMMKSIAALSKSPERTGRVIEEAIKEGMKELADALREIAGATRDQAPASQLPASFVMPTAGRQAPQPAAPARPSEGGAAMKQLVDSLPAAIADALTGNVMRVEVVNKLDIG